MERLGERDTVMASAIGAVQKPDAAAPVEPRDTASIQDQPSPDVDADVDTDANVDVNADANVDTSADASVSVDANVKEKVDAYVDAEGDSSAITDIADTDHHLPHHHPIRLAKNPSTGAYLPVLEDRFRNNLSLAVGFLELANAGDFAANVWNDIPVPIYAVVFMAIGGTGAGILSVYAIRDALFAWRNVVFLRRQRAQLKQMLERRQSQDNSSRDISVLLELNLRELGSELINRFGMDCLMGFGSVLISIGTFMAIGGANRTVFTVSNILSGYLGNTPIALYGLVNSAWAAYLATTTRGHVKATARALPGSHEYTLVHERGKKLVLYCVINGIITLVGGIASMITATRWQAYVVLIPVIVLSIFCNWFWRTRLGYSHDHMRQMPDMDLDKLSQNLRFAADARRSLARRPQAGAENDLVRQAATLPLALDLIYQSGLLEPFCISVVSDATICDSLCNPNAEQIEVSMADIAALPETLHPALLKAAHDCLRTAGVRRFAHLERFSAELLGIYTHQSQASSDLESARK